MASALTRRTALAGTGMVFLTGMAPLNLKAVESTAGGRLGFAMLDTGTRKLLGHREEERFGMCSTFKLPLAALVLQAADRRELDLSTPVPITKADIVSHAPVTKAHVGKSLSIRDLAEAAQLTSDNTAANLLMKRLGGPEGVTKRLRALGDDKTRLDRWEPAMNLVIGDDPRDTTTPQAMVKTVEKLALGDVLRPASRELLVTWMVNTRTGMGRLRAGVPTGWKVGDKTGTGMHRDMPNRINDVAVIWPPNKAPLVVAAFYEAPGHYPTTRPQDAAVLKEAMMVVLDMTQG